jgi:hypothetical protein
MTWPIRFVRAMLPSCGPIPTPTAPPQLKRTVAFYEAHAARMLGG